jgi:catechol 2,3-dioxygenase-like lactoylglutathione lyase family enzyme
MCTLLSVKDIEASRAFYEDLFGLKVISNYGKNIVFSCGLALQEEFDKLVSIPLKEIVQKSNNAEIVFEESDFDGFLEKLQSHPGIVYLGDVKEQSWGQSVIHFYDPDGHLIEVGEDMKEVTKRFLNADMSVEETAKKWIFPWNSFVGFWKIFKENRTFRIRQEESKSCQINCKVKLN